MKTTTLEQGRQSEQACCDYLQQQGLKLLEKNFRGRHGEIDLIMLEGKTLVFVEVRYRKNNNFGGALASITPQKQHRISATAEFYLQQQPKYKNARIDVVGMAQKPQNSHESTRTEYSFEWIKNAF
ncbi:MAG: YraN family protein [Gammaproteobacteria bacterium]